MSDAAIQLQKRANGLLLLAGTTLFFVVLAIVATVLDRSATTPQFATQKMFPDLTARGSEIVQVKIDTPEGAFSVVREGERWSIPERGNYRANPVKVREILTSLSGITLVEAKTARADWHAGLGVADSGEGRGTVLTALAADGSSLASVIVGKPQERAQGAAQSTFAVRKPGEDQTWIASGTIPGELSVGAWLDKTLFSLPRERIKSATLKPEGSSAYTLTRETPEVQDFTLTNIPDGKEPQSVTALNGSATSIMGLTFDDVMPAADLDVTKPSRATFKTFDGLTVEVTLAMLEGKIWAVFSAKAAEGSEAAVTAEAQQINDTTNGWAYSLPGYAGQLFLVPKDSLLRDVTPAAPAEGEAPAPTEGETP